MTSGMESVGTLSVLVSQVLRLALHDSGVTVLGTIAVCFDRAHKEVMMTSLCSSCI